MTDDTVTVFERSRPGRRAFTLPTTDVPEVPQSRSITPTPPEVVMRA